MSKLIIDKRMFIDNIDIAAGETGHIQFNANGVLAGDPAFTFNPTLKELKIAGTIDTKTINIKETINTGKLLKFSPRSLLTTPENGAFEFDGRHLYFTVRNRRRRVRLEAIKERRKRVKILENEVGDLVGED